MAGAERTERVRACSPRPGPKAVKLRHLSEGRQPRYAVDRVLHRGGMGEILLGRVLGLEGFCRPVVMKGLLAGLDDPAALDLFYREARLMARLDHPHVVRVMDLCSMDGRPYLVMEYVKGRSLHQVLQQGHGQPPLPARLTLHVVAAALRGLHHAHSLRDESGRPLGLVHRDVSPGNILLSFHGEVKLTDFGIALTPDAPRHTAPRSVRGKARYVAPELVRGGEATVLSDLHSAGVVLAEALLGRPLWDRRSLPETLMAIVSEPRDLTIEAVAAVHPGVPGLKAALRGALAITPEDRFASALQFAETLEAVGEALGPRVQPLELGLSLRGLFPEDPDVPEADGPSGLPIPRFAVEEARTESTEIRLFDGDPGLADLMEALEAMECSTGHDTRPMCARELSAMFDEEPSIVVRAVPLSHPMAERPPAPPMAERPPAPPRGLVLEGQLVTPVPPPTPIRPIRASAEASEDAVLRPPARRPPPLPSPRPPTPRPLPPPGARKRRWLSPPLRHVTLRVRRTAESAGVIERLRPHLDPPGLGLLLAGVLLGAALALAGALAAVLVGP